MADLEYDLKLEEMQKYLPFLEGLIKNLKSSKNEKREFQLTKIESLYKILINKDKKLNIDVLRKCEVAILKLYNKVEKASATLPSLAKPANEVSSEAQLTSLNIENCGVLFDYLFPNHDVTTPVQKNKNIVTTPVLPQKNVSESTAPIAEVLPSLSLNDINNLLDIAKKCHNPSSEGNAQSKLDGIGLTANPNSGYNRNINSIESGKAPKSMTGDPRVVNSSASPSSDFESIRRKLAATVVNSSIIEEYFDCPPSPFLQSERNNSIRVNHNTSKMMPTGISDLPATSCSYSSTVRNNLAYPLSSFLKSEKSHAEAPSTYPSSINPLECHPSAFLIPQNAYSPIEIGYAEIPKVMDPRLKSSGACVNPGIVKDNFLQSNNSRTGISTTYPRPLEPLDRPPSPFLNPQSAYSSVDVGYKERPKLLDPRLNLAGALGNQGIAKGNFVQTNDSRIGVSTTYPSPVVPLDCLPSHFLNPQSTFSALNVAYKERPMAQDLNRLKISAACATSSIVNGSCANTVKGPIETVQGSFPYRPSPMAMPRQCLPNMQGIPSLLSVKPNEQNISMPILNTHNEIRPSQVYTRKPHLVQRFPKNIPVARNQFRKDPVRCAARNSFNPNIAKKDVLPDKGQAASDVQEQKLLEPVIVQTPALSCLDTMYRNDAYDVTVKRSIKDFKIPKIKKTVTVDQGLPTDDSNDKGKEPCGKEKDKKLSTEMETKKDNKSETETVKSDSETTSETVSIIRQRSKSLSEPVSEFEKSVATSIIEDEIDTCSVEIEKRSKIKAAKPKETIPCAKQRRKSLSHRAFCFNDLNDTPPKPRRKSLSQRSSEINLIANEKNTDVDPIMEDQVTSTAIISDEPFCTVESIMEDESTPLTIISKKTRRKSLSQLSFNSSDINQDAEINVKPVEPNRDVEPVMEDQSDANETIPKKQRRKSTSPRAITNLCENSDAESMKPVNKEVMDSKSNVETMTEDQSMGEDEPAFNVISLPGSSRKSLSRRSFSISTKTFDNHSKTARLDEVNMDPVGSSSNTDPMSDDDTPLSDILKRRGCAGSGSKGLSHADAKSGLHLTKENKNVTEKFNSIAETMSEDDTATTIVKASIEPVRRSLPQTNSKRRKLPKRAEPSTIINSDILEKNIVKGHRLKRFKLSDNAVAFKKRKSQTCSVSSTTDSYENETANTNKSQEDTLPAESSKKDEINKVWLEGLLNPSVVSTNAVLEMLEKVLDTEKFKQIKTILESDKPNDVDEILPAIGESHSKPIANHRKKTELDRLNEDIREMFICNEVLSATGRRGCTLNKNKISDHANSTKLLKTELKISVPASRKIKLRSKQKQKGKSQSKTAAEAKSDSSAEEQGEGPKEDPEEDPKEDPKEDPTEDPEDDPKEVPEEDPKEDPEEDPKEEILLQLVVGKGTSEGFGTDTNETIKNIDPKMHPLSKYGKKCALCEFRSRYIACHYVNKHHCEVLTSRLPPGVKERLEANGGKTAVTTEKFPKLSRTVFEYLCPFCETKLAFKNCGWLKHFTMHTGEYFTKCSKCGLRKNKLHSHITKNCPGATIVRTRSPNEHRTIFHAYICDLCNYIQMNRQQIVEHLINQHLCFKEQITEIVLLNLNELDVDIGPPLLERETTLATTECAEKLKRPALRKRLIVRVEKMNMDEIERIIRESKTKVEVAATIDEEIASQSSKSEREDEEEPTAETVVVSGEVKDSVEAVRSDETGDSQIFKNVHSEMHTQSRYASCCALCSAKSSYLPIHYINVHKSEVLTSRLPPDVQERFMQDSTAGNTHKLGRKYWYICPFCDIQKSLVPKVWIDHLSTHTGEYNFKCSKCSNAQNKITAITKHIQRSCPDAHVIRDTQKCREKNAVLGFICDLCSYIQMNYNNVVQHLSSQHNYSDELISTIILINFMSSNNDFDVSGNQDGNIYENINEIDSYGAVSIAQTTLDPIKDENLTNSMSLDTGEANEHSLQHSYVDPEPSEPLVLKVVEQVVEPNALQDNNCIVISDDEDDLVGPKPASFSVDSSNYQVAENPIDDDENWEDIDSPPQPPQVSKTKTTANSNVEESKAKNTKTIYPALDRLYASIVETTITKSFDAQNKNESSTSNVSDDTVRINRLAYKESSSGRRYHCLAEFCTFPSTAILFELKAHLINKHRDILWGGYCHSCRRIVSVDTDLKLLDEFVHMEKVHLRTQGIQFFQPATEKKKPILKVRHLSGDSLSSFIGQTISQKSELEAAASSLAAPPTSKLNLQVSSSAAFATNTIKTVSPQLELASVSNVVVSGSLTATTNVETNNVSPSSELKIANISSARVNTDAASNTVKCKNVSIPMQSKYTNAVTNDTHKPQPLRIVNVYSAGSNNSAVSTAHDLGNITSLPAQLKIANVSSAAVNAGGVSNNTVKCKNVSIPMQSKYTNAVTSVTHKPQPLRIANVYSAGSNNSAVSTAHGFGNITSLPAQLNIADVSSAGVNTGGVSNITSLPSQLKIASIFSGAMRSVITNASVAEGVSKVSSMPSPLKITKISSAGVKTGEPSKISSMPSQLKTPKTSNVSAAGVNTGVASKITSLPSQLKIASIFSGAMRSVATNASAAEGVSEMSSMPSSLTNISSAAVNESKAQGVSNITAMRSPLKIASVSSGVINTGGVNTFPSQGIINISPIPQLKMADVSIAAKISAPPDASNTTPSQLKITHVSSAEGNISPVPSASTATTVGKESRTPAPTSTSSSIAQKLLPDPNSGKTVLRPWTESRSVKSEVIVSRLLQKKKLLAFFKCMGNDCDFVTNDSAEMKSHLNCHKPLSNQTSDVPEWLECCYCNYSTANVVSLISHCIEKHKTDIYQCPYCFYRTCEEYNVLVHLGNHHPTNEFIIYVCPGKKPDQTIEFNIAEYRMMRNVKYITDKDRPKSKLPLVHGMFAKLSISPELFQCMLCIPNNAMVGKQQLLDHLMTQHNVTCYHCVHCTFGTDNKLRMNTHMSNCHPSHLLFCCVRLEMLKSTVNEQLYIYKEFPNRTALILLKRKVKDKYLHLCEPNVTGAVQVIDNDKRKKPPPTLKKVDKRKVDSVAQLPRSEIFGVPLFCSMCGYGSKVRMNLVRHFQLHAENESKVANIDPVNPVPCLNAPEKHFDRMTNLACSSNTKK